MKSSLLHLIQQRIWRQQQQVENTISKAEQHVSSFDFLIIGIIFGLLGGMWGQVFDRYFYMYGLIYILALALISCILLIFLFGWVVKKIDPLIEKAKQEQGVVKKLTKELELHIEKQEKNSKENSHTLI